MKPPTPDNPNKPESGMLAAPGAGASAESGAIILPGPGYVLGTGAVVDSGEPDADRQDGADAGEGGAAASDSLSLSFAKKLAQLAELYTLDDKDDIERYLSDNQDLLAPLIEIHPLIADHPEVMEIHLEHYVFEQGDRDVIHIIVRTSIKDVAAELSFEDRLCAESIWGCHENIQQRILLSTDYGDSQNS